MSIDIHTGNAIRPYPSCGASNKKEISYFQNPKLGPIKHLILVFGGWGSTDAGNPIPKKVNQTTGTTLLLNKIRSLNSKEQIEVRAFHASLMLQSEGISAANFIKQNFHPKGKLVIYGYSAGGGSAITLAWSIWQNLTYYEFATKTFKPLIGGHGNRTDGSLGLVRVDSLITIDAAAGPGSPLMFRRIPPAVRRNLNIYQTVPSTWGSSESTAGSSRTGVRSAGAPNLAHDPRATDMMNINATQSFKNAPGRGHGNIDNRTINQVLEEINKTLSVPE